MFPWTSCTSRAWIQRSPQFVQPGKVLWLQAFWSSISLKKQSWGFNLFPYETLSHPLPLKIPNQRTLFLLFCLVWWCYFYLKHFNFKTLSASDVFTRPRCTKSFLKFRFTTWLEKAGGRDRHGQVAEDKLDGFQQGPDDLEERVAHNQGKHELAFRDSISPPWQNRTQRFTPWIIWGKRIFQLKSWNLSHEI